MSNKFENLHDAMEEVLLDQPGKTATVTLIRDEIAKRDLWVRDKDGKYPQNKQIRARAVQYPRMFEVLPSATIKLIK